VPVTVSSGARKPVKIRSRPRPGSGGTQLEMDVVPLPSTPALSAQALPPIASARARTIASPIPEPPAARLRAASTR